MDAGALDTANDEVLGIIQIESPQAAGNAEKIAALPGVDVLFVGPRDLSHAMGIPGQMSHPEFQDVLRHVVRVASEAGIAAGTLAAGGESALRYAEQGFTFIGVGSDSSTLAMAVKSALETASSRQ